MVSLSKNHQKSSVGGAPGAGSANFGSLDKLDLSQIKVLNHHQGVSSVNQSAVDLEKQEEY